MAHVSVAGLIETLRHSALLQTSQLDEMEQELQHRFSAPQELCNELLRRGWLTPYQANRLLQGRGAELVLGQYVLLERLGGGGMGQVFKARHQRLQRLVALKVIREDWLEQSGAVERFQREARAAARLQHLHIVTIYDADEVNGTHFLVMEYLEGIDLERRVAERGPLPVDAACQYIRQAALGLQHAHERGLVHRDIKPANLLLTDECHAGAMKPMVKILDFGLARLRAETVAAGSDRLTQEGAMMGTVDYLAPEQAKDSHAVDIRADLYSLGCTLYFLLTGHTPFAGTAMEKLFKHQWTEPAPVEQDRADLPVALSAVVRKLMAKQPQDRYQSPAEAAAALALAVPTHVATKGSSQASAIVDQRIAGETTQPWPAPPMPQAPVRRSWRWRARLGAAGFACIVALVLLSSRFLGPGPPQPPPDAGPLDGLDATNIPASERFEGQPPEIVAVLGQHAWRHWARIGCVAFSPDRKLVGSGGGDGVRLWQVDTGRQRTFVPQASVVALAFAPDGDLLAMGSTNLRLWDLAAGKDRHSIDGRIWAVAFSSDRKLFAAGTEVMEADRTIDVIKLWDAHTWEELSCLRGHSARIQYLAFSPDSQTLASSSDDRTVKLWNVPQREDQKTIRDFKVAPSLAFAPDGKTLALADGNLTLWDLSAARRRPVPEAPQGLSDRVAYGPDSRTLIVGYVGGSALLLDLDTGKQRPLVSDRTDRIPNVAIAPDGLTAATVHENNGLMLWDVATAQPKTQANWHLSSLTGLAFAPDRAVLATAGFDHTVRLWNLMTARETHTLRGHEQPVTGVAFAPDGRTLASGSRDHTVKLWDAETGTKRRTLKGHEGPVTCLAFSGDGQTLVTGSEDQTVRLWDTATGQPLQVCQGHGATVQAVAFAPDGRTVVSGSGRPYERDQPGELKLWNVATGKESGGVAGLPHMVACVAFAPDGQSVALGTFDGVVRHWDLDSQPPPAVIGEHRGPIRLVAWAGRGTRVLAASEDGEVLHWPLHPGVRPRAIVLPGTINAAACAADGRHLATGNHNGTVYILHIATP